MDKNKIQTLESYPARDEIKEFLSAYTMAPLKTIDNDAVYQVNYKIPPVWFILLCLLFPVAMLFIMDPPPAVKYIMLSMMLVIIPVFIFVFNKLFRGPLKAQEIRFKYDKAGSKLSIPHLELEILNSDIIEFVVIYGKMETDSGKSLIAELSLIYKEHEEIKRVPLFLSGKSVCTRTAEKLTEYSGKKNTYEKL